MLVLLPRILFSSSSFLSAKKKNFGLCNKYNNSIQVIQRALSLYTDLEIVTFSEDDTTIPELSYDLFPIDESEHDKSWCCQC
ncbi:hypothetical protein QN277_005648 [Acacia crassicarpa]|uniref:Uncharacterized protein n=1 Tax=Acacia crassicarpa TaxID=499986 RepID=A0AAE1J042_9FABA|nr:hypothetical protein QN277_005648 [Acacia crassicarpa]